MLSVDAGHEAKAEDRGQTNPLVSAARIG